MKKRWALGGCLLLGILGANGQTPQGELIFLRDFGTDEVGYLAIPETPPGAGLVIAHGKYGLNPDLRVQCDQLAGQGFIALAVDLFNGKIPQTDEDLEEITENYNIKTAVDALVTGLNFFSLSPRFKMKKKILVGIGESTRDVLAAARQDKTVAGITLLDPDVVPNQKFLRELGVPIQAIVSSERSLGINLEDINAGVGQGPKLHVVRMPQVLYEQPGQFQRSINQRVWTEAMRFWGDLDPPEQSIADRLIESVF